MTFNEYSNMKEAHSLFFHLLGIEIERAFNYAINNKIGVLFVDKFVHEGLKKSIIGFKGMVKHLLKYLYCLITQQLEAAKPTYFKYKRYVAIKM